MPKVHYVKCAALLMMVALLVAGCHEPTKVEPTPQFIVTPGEGTAPLTVRFEDASDPGNTTIEAWSWSFGDGGVSNGRNPEYLYRLPGVYDVTLTITTSEGNFTAVRQGAVTVSDADNSGEPDDTNNFTSGSISIQLPQAYDKDIAFGVREGGTGFSLAGLGPAEVISPVCTIWHSQSSPDLFVYDDNGNVKPSTLSVSLLNPLPISSVPLSQAQLFARLEDGRTVPIPGVVDGNQFVATVLRLPKRADYVVVRRAGLTITRVNGKSAGEAKAEGASSDWLESFTIYASHETEQAITALYEGSMSDEDSFKRRDYPSAVVEEDIRVLIERMRRFRSDLIAAGMRAPSLVNADGGYTLNLFNMLPSYTYDIDYVSELGLYDNFFGHLVLDPEQLVAVTIRNLRASATDEDALDLTERYYPESAFGEVLLKSVYAGYLIPDYTTKGNTALGLPIPADRTVDGKVRAVSYIEGLQNGAALYFGRRYLDYRGRGFGANEYGKLSLQAMFPYSPFFPGYSYANHEFLAWLESAGFVSDPLQMLAKGLSNMNAALDQVALGLTRPLDYREALAAMYIALNKAVEEDPSTVYPSFASLYWEFLKDSAYVNGWDAILRPSDTQRLPFTFNADRFLDGTAVTIAFEGATFEKEVSPLEYGSLGNIPPMAARAIVLDLNPMTTDVELFVDTSLQNSGYYVPSIAVYRAGQDGVEFADLPGTMRNYSLTDTDEDGRTDTVRISGLGCLQNGCESRVIILIANLQYEDPASVVLSAKGFSSLPVGDDGVLARFVSTYDPTYEYSLKQVFDFSTTYGCVVYVLQMTSGVWRNEEEVDATLWQHKILVIEPVNVEKNTGMLYLTGGSSTENNTLTADEQKLIEQLGLLAWGSRTAVSILTVVPNQPLLFAGEGDNATEEDIMAYSLDRYMSSYDLGERDPAWPVLLPMTRAAVRAMDTIQDFMENKPGRVRTVDNFVVGGIAKRGWAAWLTAAVDDRVSAVMPIAADYLNFPGQMRHHRNAYGSYPLSDSEVIYSGYSTAWRQYVDYNVLSRLELPSGESLMRIVDPYSYREVLTMPKLLVNSTGDGFFLPDSSRFFMPDLTGTNYLHYAPNSDYSILKTLELDEDALEALGAFYISQVDGSTMPSFDASYNASTREIIVKPSEPPLSVEFWSANSSRHRDFRQQTLGDKWSKEDVPVEDDGTYRATLSNQAGYNAGFMKVRFSGPLSDVDYIFSTRVWVWPDTYPAP